MNNKILIGSIIAVAILVLVSFTGVVGFKSVKSNVKASPLFIVRSKRAIDRDSKGIVCDYVGKGEENDIQIPKRDDRTALQQKFTDIISKTDDKTFKVYLNLIINQIQKKDRYDDLNINKVITDIHQLRDNSDRIGLNVFNNGDQTWRYEFKPTICWVPFCFIYIIFYLFFIFITADVCYSFEHHDPTFWCVNSDF